MTFLVVALSLALARRPPSSSRTGRQGSRARFPPQPQQKQGVEYFRRHVELHLDRPRKPGHGRAAQGARPFLRARRGPTVSR